MSRIEVTIGGRTERVPVPSEPDAIVFGTDESSTFRIPDEGAAARHLLIEERGGMLLGRAADAAPPVLLNGIRIDLAAIRAGDVLTIGEVRVRFLESAPEPERSAPVEPRENRPLAAVRSPRAAARAAAARRSSPAEPDSPGMISWILFALSVAFLAWFMLRAIFPPGTGGG